MNYAFLDTVGLLAVWDRHDQWHEGAERAFRNLVADRTPLLTTTFVLAECGSAAARKPYRTAPDRLRRELEQADRLILPTSEDWDAAWIGYARSAAGDAGVVDYLSFTVMRRLGMTRAFTNDRHFAAAGFELMF